ncbi:unnamed protein product [Amoebophrya sp. A120]|nr:unnamed protein product [Amoebophrya sp. A120]|eukprot:GSA120T00023595001.1
MLSKMTQMTLVQRQRRRVGNVNDHRKSRATAVNIALLLCFGSAALQTEASRLRTPRPALGQTVEDEQQIRTENNGRRTSQLSLLRRRRHLLDVENANKLASSSNNALSPPCDGSSFCVGQRLAANSPHVETVTRTTISQQGGGGGGAIPTNRNQGLLSATEELATPGGASIPTNPNQGLLSATEELATPLPTSTQSAYAPLATSTQIDYAGIPSRYTLALDCPGSDREKFLDCFVPYKDRDPTEGNVDYIRGWDEFRDELITVQANPTNPAKKQISIDFKTGALNGADNRPAIRLHSKLGFEYGSLFVVDVERMPALDGVWPAYWTCHKGGVWGGNWPGSGEFDLMEHIHGRRMDQMRTTLHTDFDQKCEVSMDAGSPGNLGPAGTRDLRLQRGNCEGYEGCEVDANQVPNGRGFNIARGGLHIMAVEEDAVKFWWVPRDQVTDANFPDADTAQGAFWEQKLQQIQPYVVFPLNHQNCPSRALFKTQTLIINTTFCGTWAGEEYQRGGLAACEALVRSDLYGKPEQKNEKGEDLWDQEGGIRTNFVFNSIKMFAKDDNSPAWDLSKPLR